MKEYILREHDNGAKEIIVNNAPSGSVYRKIVYANGDVIYLSQTDRPCSERVVKIIPHDNLGLAWPGCENPNTNWIDEIVFPRRTLEAKMHSRRQEVLERLRSNPHHYDGMMQHVMRCKRCNGTGEVKTGDYDVGVWESEGGACHVCPVCKGDKPVITEEMVHQFYETSRTTAWGPLPRAERNPKQHAIVSKFKQIVGQ